MVCSCVLNRYIEKTWVFYSKVTMKGGVNRSQKSSICVDFHHQWQFSFNEDLFLHHKACFEAETQNSCLEFLYTHVSVCTGQLILRKPQKSQKNSRIFFSLINANCNQRSIFFSVLFVHPWDLVSRKYVFDLKWAIEMSLITKWGRGGKIWDWYIIWQYFAEYLTPILNLGPR